MKIEHIGVAGDLYLTKVFISSDIPDRFWPFKWRPAIHIFTRPDLDRVFHDHPWNFRTFVLWGGYDETAHVFGMKGEPTGETADDTLRFLSMRHRRAEHAHRITRLHSRRVVTLILMDRKRREWGFWHPPRTLQDTPWWVWQHWRDFHDIPHPTPPGAA